MTVRAKPTTPRRKRRSSGSKLSLWLPLLDTLAMLAWGVLLLKYWLTGKINVLLHPDYVWLAYSAGFFLVGVALLKGLQLPLRFRRVRTPSGDLASPQHFSIFPPGWSSALLLIVALFGLQFTPRPFASQVALARGVTDSLTMTRSQPQSFRASTSPDQRSLVEWVRTLNVYPEPDAYTGQPANVEGFVIHSDETPANYIIISRFVITCCAADVYPVGIPVKLPEGDRSDYPADMWLRVEGEMMTETLGGKRQLVIQAKTLEEIPEPDTPYDF
ncbi:TIGR03943 family protein [filamentous cyanobacterium CCP1]|nr:TIGR03943 family protein [filamentous cyanobacterium CCP2]PSB68276.1 TIGR03943 family protein [filamentous cyanobacterium CCP1]